MAKYKVLVPSQIDGVLIDQKMIDAAGSDGYIVEYAGIASDNLQLVDPSPKGKADAKDDTTKAEADIRKEAIAAKVLVDGKPITPDTPFEQVALALAAAKQLKVG